MIDLFRLRFQAEFASRLRSGYTESHEGKREPEIVVEDDLSRGGSRRGGGISGDSSLYILATIKHIGAGGVRATVNRSLS